MFSMPLVMRCDPCVYGNIQVHLNKLVVEKLIYFSNSTQIVKLVY